MTGDGFKRLALSFPDATEGSHFGHADFRVGGRIFATLAALKAGYGTLILLPDQQSVFVDEHPDLFLPVPGGWGLKGATFVRLAPARVSRVRPALGLAFENALAKGPTHKRKARRRL
jgi:hypothetical protein